LALEDDYDDYGNLELELEPSTETLPTTTRASRSTPGRIFRGRMMKKTHIVFNDHQDHLDSINGYTVGANHTLVQFLALAVPILMVVVTFSLMYLRISTVLEVKIRKYCGQCYNTFYSRML
jgi:hypothetical protein